MVKVIGLQTCSVISSTVALLLLLLGWSCTVSFYLLWASYGRRTDADEQSRSSIGHWDTAWYGLQSSFLVRPLVPSARLVQSACLGVHTRCMHATAVPLLWGRLGCSCREAYGTTSGSHRSNKAAARFGGCAALWCVSLSPYLSSSPFGPRARE